MDEIQYPLTGACQCGNVRYQLLKPPLKVVACHCRQCQKLSTSAFSLTAQVRAEDIVFSGELHDWQRPAYSGRINSAKFCPICGNRIYHYDPAKPGLIKLKPSNLEDTRVIRPTVHIWVNEKQDWFDIPAGATVYGQAEI